MANPTDSLPAFAVPGLPSTVAPIPQAQPNLPPLAQQQPPVVVPPAPVPVNRFVPRGPTPYGVPGATAATPVAQSAVAAATAPAAALPLDNRAVNDATGPEVDNTTAAVPAASAETPAIADTRQRAVLPDFNSTANAAPTVGMVGTPAQAGPFRDPQATISAGYDRQQQYAQNFMDQALRYISGGGDIFEQATRGRAISGILHAVAGQNNEGSAQAQGADALNSAIAGVTSAGISAQAQQYGADSSVLAGQQRNQTQLADTRMQIASRPVPIGNTSGINNLNLPYNEVHYALPQFGTGGMVPSTLKPVAPPSDQQRQQQPVAELSTGVRNGKSVIYRNGQWVDQ